MESKFYKLLKSINKKLPLVGKDHILRKLLSGKLQWRMTKEGIMLHTSARRQIIGTLATKVLMYLRIITMYNENRLSKKLAKILNNSKLNDKWVERANLLKIEALENYGSLDRALKQ